MAPAAQTVQSRQQTWPKEKRNTSQVRRWSSCNKQEIGKTISSFSLVSPHDTEGGKYSSLVSDVDSSNVKTNHSAQNGTQEAIYGKKDNVTPITIPLRTLK